MIDAFSANEPRNSFSDEGGGHERHHHGVIVGHLRADYKGRNGSLDHAREVRDHSEQHERSHRRCGKQA